MGRDRAIELTFVGNLATLLRIKGCGIVLKVANENIGLVSGVEDFSFALVQLLALNHAIASREISHPILLDGWDVTMHRTVTRVNYLVVMVWTPSQSGGGGWSR